MFDKTEFWNVSGQGKNRLQNPIARSHKTAIAFPTMHFGWD